MQLYIPLTLAQISFETPRFLVRCVVFLTAFQIDLKDKQYLILKPWFTAFSIRKEIVHGNILRVATSLNLGYEQSKFEVSIKRYNLLKRINFLDTSDFHGL